MQETLKTLPIHNAEMHSLSGFLFLLEKVCWTQSFLLQGSCIAHPLEQGLATCGRTKLDTGRILVSATPQNLKIIFFWYKWSYLKGVHLRVPAV